MMRSLGVLAVLLAAVGSFGCTLHQQQRAAAPSQTTQEAVAAEDDAFGASPRYRAESPTSVKAADAPEGALLEDVAPAAETKGSPRGAYGYIADSAGNALIVEHEYSEENAAPGTACYEAAKKMGLKGEATCTLINERQFVLVNDADNK